MSIEEESKLSTKEKFELAVQAGLNLIPGGIGGAISNVYFGLKQEKRFKRIELFLREIALRINNIEDAQLNDIKNKLQSIDSTDKERLAFIIDELLEKVEREIVKKKIEYFLTYFMNTLNSPVHESTFDERNFFLDTLAAMSIIECDFLSHIYSQNQSVEVANLQRDDLDKFAIVGAISRLKNYGFLESAAIRYTAENPLNDLVRITSFGKKFCDFCINESGK